MNCIVLIHVNCIMIHNYVLQQLFAGYKTREQAIKKCINEVTQNAQKLRDRRDKNSDDTDLMRDLRKEQTKVTKISH